ncbi:adenine-specific DNA-methyltransferase [Cyclonatronum proteinivorum]|uniref:site-specific DNA-methyltransferase (adenine-specific) n=1 Tax=Cyclonatronum proteinivorum TaxID=1457365 RepID=A0A345ULT6_9BACT|nr:site-specific DNA-methyltransferase [Cyclonatronum proteinivorum]AXJ01438.1 adenine-specific DNA-methyltransferase [Cyclonatronum proteinivorum]
MPTLNWIGKEKVINHHRDVPFRVLNHKYGFTAEKGETNKPTNSGNKIIHGDNLEALKSLLPEYEGQVKCIYIDPPYNTGNEGWVYNDNVSHPKLKKWLGEVVGKEGDDLSRHDKWLCMMYPRLQILKRLLSIDGLIFISIDDNEYQSLKFLCDEIFGRQNFITNFSWRTDGNFDNQAKIKINHEYILCFAKKISQFEHPRIVDPNIDPSSKLFRRVIRNTIVKNGPKNPVSSINLPIGFPAEFESGVLEPRNDAWPKFDEPLKISGYKLEEPVSVSSGWSSKKLLESFIHAKFKPVLDTKQQLTRFVITNSGAIEALKDREQPSHVVSSLKNMGSTQNMSSDLKKMGINFDYPKPNSLLEYLLSIHHTKDHYVLDSFAGSGTTAHAVLNLNKKDGGNRKFILIEMEDYAEKITAKRIKKVIIGYGDGKNEVEGTGGSFDYYELGEPLFIGENAEYLNEKVGAEKIRSYIWFSETRTPYQAHNQQSETDYFLGAHEQTAYYFYYLPQEITTLDHDFLASVKTKAEQYVIYADNCLLSKEYLSSNNIIFKKIPRDINRF